MQSLDHLFNIKGVGVRLGMSMSVTERDLVVRWAHLKRKKGKFPPEMLHRFHHLADVHHPAQPCRELVPCNLVHEFASFTVPFIDPRLFFRHSSLIL